MVWTSRLEEAIAFVESRGYTCAYAALYGSQNYGLELDTPDYRSDVDIKCAVLPGLSALAREEAVAPETLEWQGGQIEIKDVRRFAEVAAKQNPAYLETLLTPHYIAPCAEFEQIRALAGELLACDPAGFMQACRGAAMVKKKNLCHPFPAAMEKIRCYGYDGKQAHHMYRMLLVMRAFALTGRYELHAPQEAYKSLIALKRNEVPLAQALEMTEAWAQEMDAICSSIPRGRSTKAIAGQMRELACRAIEAHIARQVDVGRVK